MTELYTTVYFNGDTPIDVKYTEYKENEYTRPCLIRKKYGKIKNGIQTYTIESGVKSYAISMLGLLFETRYEWSEFIKNEWEVKSSYSNEVMKNLLNII